ncbi:hypothetical protein C5167_011862 [Papaver somniferum]|uniref:MPN domain-containing protein n=1 Tax=Papaver somniferum TaxID=3469 RepID=A0A4Y7IVT6_PAPSO|nr:hypothetical protein C5167_011862 [Papaver somniferum]
MGITVTFAIFARLLVVMCVLSLGDAARNLNDHTTINDNPKKSGSSSSMVLNLASIEMIIPEFNKTISLPALVSLPVEVIDIFGGKKEKHTIEYIFLGATAAGELIASLAPQDGNIDVPLRDYYRTVGSLLEQETIPCHPDYLDTLAMERSVYRKKLSAVMSELRSIKADVYRGVTELNKAYYHSQSADSTNQKITSDLETSQLYPTGRSASQASSRHNNLFSRHNNSFQTVSSNNMHTEMQFQKIDNIAKVGPSAFLTDGFISRSFILLPPKEETLSRRPIFGPNGVDKSTMDTVLPLDDGRWSRSAEESCSSGIIIKELLQVNKIRQPLPPPVLAELKQHDPSQVADPRPGPAKSMQDEIFDSNSYQHLHIVRLNPLQPTPSLLPPANMMEGFLRLALENTKKNLETCGVLAGKMENRVFHITTLIIPKKEATSDSCLAMKEELLFEFQDKLSLSPLGWIHTHPSQTCAMSSVDLHTQYAYQIMLPEAIAIVMAPSDTYRQHGIFHLSDPGGVSLIRHCQQRGFHAHEEPSDGSPIYEHCSHVYMDPKLKFEIVDLR